MDGKQLQQQYKDFLSDFHSWDQKEHADEWLLFEANIGPLLSIDETALSNGELYTIVSNKEAKGGKKAIVAMIKGTQADQIMAVLGRIPLRKRNKVKEVTMDMAANMIKAIRRCFSNASRVIDRFHVQKLAYDAVQELRIKYRWEALDTESKAIEEARKGKQPYLPGVFSNGDTLKQLLARSRYLLFKHESKWTASQKERAGLLFPQYPELLKAYKLAIGLGNIFTICKSREIAFKRLALWYNHVEESGIDAFKTVARSVHQHYESILNFFDNRSTNASAESFNAKIKAFRATSRGVRDTTFFLFRLTNIYA
ncbi:transposase [Mucilaginibacter rubeus]|uniref:Transposase n=1 Tax=Mucilaginibacter rubeus TaxID=2027860 RepID=A0AAE6JMW7_9SPHI|nr:MULTISPECIES: transposase [Mucilaginibacter]QEM08410.1 transposase [Mucilaginibacter rubeus]QEM20840.1 transposase [Mucilaginibacter gossypii]QTE47193.1 transposase [Mucilaginibacter rubeus]QTE53790.1 transposase [Mucilaginibacter rubeus]QTE60304.1 transposase [Mucilaginibacter rubeus]